MTDARLRRLLIAEGVPAGTVEAAPSTIWGNGPGDRYAAHRHGYDKVLLAVSGSITFDLPELGRRVTLAAGERLDLPSGTSHAAEVGPAGVDCLELHLPAGSLTSRPETGRDEGA
jgi:mannose-6-phosphate isomerase-like protein (cupin superfamily)